MPMTDNRLYAPTTLRNRDPILSVLHDVLPTTGTVLRLPPKEGIRHAAQLTPGQSISAEGRSLTTPMGRVVEVDRLD